MTEQMQPLTVYKCQHCEKLFRTPDRHQCKFRPELRNCFTCKHLKGWLESKDGVDVGIGILPDPNYPNCAAEVTGWDIVSIRQVGYNMQCEDWEAQND
jgi:hypothetical protein